jgi:hypothetical protein
MGKTLAFYWHNSAIPRIAELHITGAALRLC